MNRMWNPDGSRHFTSETQVFEPFSVSGDETFKGGSA